MSNEEEEGGMDFGPVHGHTTPPNKDPKLSDLLIGCNVYDNLLDLHKAWTLQEIFAACLTYIEVNIKEAAKTNNDEKTIRETLLSILEEMGYKVSWKIDTTTA